MRILIIEDDRYMAETLGAVLGRSGFQVDTVDSGHDGLAVASRNAHSLVILDLVLPDMHGYDLLRRMREGDVEIPTLVLSSLDEWQMKANCLFAGADDYLTKPFDKRELIARIRAILHRSNYPVGRSLHIGSLEVDLSARVAKVDGTLVPLSRREFEVLEVLALRRGTILTKDMIQTHLYGGMDAPRAKGIDLFVCKLRQKLAAAHWEDSCIETVWGLGYRIPAEPAEKDH